MNKERLDITLCTLSENILALTGYWTLTGLSALIIFPDSNLTLIAPISEKRICKGKKYNQY